MKTHINHIIDTLIKELHIDQIYQWTYARDGKKLPILHIHLIPESGMRFGEAKEICVNIFEKHPNIHFTLHYRQEAQHLIDQGLGLLALVCRPENKVYQSELSSGDVVLPAITTEDMTNRCKAYIADEQKKVLSFLSGYEFYLESGNYVYASFMLHQALELTLRTAFLLLLGSEKKSHYVVNQIATLKTFDSKLGRLSIKDKDLLALKELDTAYSAARYNQGFQTDPAHLTLAYQVLKKAMDWMEAYQMEYIRYIERELDPSYIAQKRTQLMKEKYRAITATLDPSDHREFILRALDAHCNAVCVKSFAYRKAQRQVSNLLMAVDERITVHHYYLFVMLDDPIPHTVEMQMKINQLLPAHIRVTLIMENAASTYQKARKGKRLFYDMLQGGETWFDEGRISEQEIQALPVPHSSTTYAKKQWSNRVQNASMFATMRNNLERIGDERAVCFGLALATEQVCLGLIKLFLGYSPISTNLNYLMSFVDIILPEASSAFYRDRATDNKLFGLLIEAQHEFRHSPNYRTGDFEVGILQDRVNEFIRIASSCVEAHFEAQTDGQSDLVSGAEDQIKSPAQVEESTASKGIERQDQEKVLCA